MAYNKTKFVEAAQRYLAQGKIAQAIAEYKQILKQEPKDQVTLMTVGDLFVRQGETFQALEYFERLAQVFLSDGFIAKAIAIYKKVAKLAPEETKPLERLAELYVQQGVMSEARPLYLQLAEVHLKANRHSQAVALLHKLLEAEPENLRVQTRLAELYNAIGQPKEAVETYTTAAQRLLERGEHADAEKLAERALKIDAHHAGALTLRARALVGAGKRADATKVLEGLPELDSGTETSVLLTEQYLQGGQLDRAAKLAQKVFERTKKFNLAHKVGAALVEAGQLDPGLELLGLIREAMVEAGESEHLAQVLTSAAGRAPGRLELLEWLVDLYSRTSDSFRMPDALMQLAEAAAAAGQLERAKQVYEQLLDRQRENEKARRGLDKVLVRMGRPPAERPTAEPSPRPGKPAEVPLVEAQPAPSAAETELDEETQRYLTQALTDVDLFSSYGLTQKAVDLLESVLQRAPRHAATLEKLLDLHLGAGNDRSTAELAAQLEQIHEARGDTKNAARFSELRRRFQRAAGLSDEELTAAPPAEFALPTVRAVPVSGAQSQTGAEMEAVPAGEAAVHEVDLSEEWAALATQEAETEAPPEVAPAREATQQAEVLAQASSAAPAAIPSPPAPDSRRTAKPVSEPAGEYELELVPDEQEPASAQPPAAALSSEQFLSDLAAQFGALTTGTTAPEPPVPAAPSAGRNSDTDEPLREVFDEFRAELGEMGAEEEDLETHYNLGIAFREMGLLEEAIGEFQKVAKENDKGRAFRYAMQCCTLLGLAFMEKGQPAIAAMWYERALRTPGLDQESILALRYDLGVAQELAGDEKGALKSFSQVYGMNIDYRDVAERITALGKRR